MELRIAGQELLAAGAVGAGTDANSQQLLAQLKKKAGWKR